MSRYCAQCGKAKKACICAWIQKLTAETELIILQHPTEVNRAKGTAKILTLSLTNSHNFVGEDFSTHTELNQLLDDRTYRHLLLYPSQNAISLDDNLVTVTADNKKLRVVLLDGTWKKAYKMYHLSRNLQSLQTYVLPEVLKGNYTIRKAPDANSLSTVEAGYHALSILEPQVDFLPLLTAFESMVDFYLQQIPKEVVQQNYKLSE